MCIFGAKNADFDPKIRILGPKSKTLCTTTMVCQYGNFFVLTVLHRKLLGGRRGQFWAQNTHIFSLRSQFRTFFGPTDPDSMGKCRGNVLTLPLMCLDMHSVLFWPIGGPFSRGKYEKYTFYEIQKYGLKMREILKAGSTMANVAPRAFRWYRTLWGSDRATLRKIASTSGAIWGKLPPTVSQRMSPLGVAH